MVRKDDFEQSILQLQKYLSRGVLQNVVYNKDDLKNVANFTGKYMC